MVIRPEDTLWYMMYVTHHPPSERMFCLFQLRFRLSYESFMSLSEYVKNDLLFAQWSRSDAVGDKTVSLQLLLLGALRYISRGWKFDNYYEATGISIATNRFL